MLFLIFVSLFIFRCYKICFVTIVFVEVEGIVTSTYSNPNRYPKKSDTCESSENQILNTHKTTKTAF